MVPPEGIEVDEYEDVEPEWEDVLASPTLHGIAGDTEQAPSYEYSVQESPPYEQVEHMPSPPSTLPVLPPSLSPPADVEPVQPVRVSSLSSPNQLRGSLFLEDLDLHAMPDVQLPGFNPHGSYAERDRPVSANGSVLSATGSKNSAIISNLGTSLLMRNGTNRSNRSVRSHLAPEAGETMTRKRSLVRPDRSRQPRQDLLALGGLAAVDGPTYLEKHRKRKSGNEQRQWGLWMWFCRIVTFYAPDVFLEKCGGMRNPKVGS
jgi:hypothetical protein